MQKLIVLMLLFLFTIPLSSCGQKVDKEIEEKVLRGIPNVTLKE